MNGVSVILITSNEQERIRACLEAVAWADEIVVIDQSSRDATAALARAYTDKVFVVPPKGYCEPDRAVAVSKTTNDWVLYIDADEIITPELRDEIRALLAAEPPCRCYYILRKNYLLGRWIRGSGWHPNYCMRLFRKDAVSYSDRIHVDIAPRGTCGYLKHGILHYSYDTLADYLEKLNRYTTILARQAYECGKRVSPRTWCADFCIVPFAHFFRKLVLCRGYADGWYGYLIAVFTFFTIFLQNAKITELQGRAEKAERKGAT